MSDTWWMPTPGPDGESWEVSADGTQLRIDGFVFDVVDVPRVNTAAGEPGTGTPVVGGWS